jgi:UDP:flavonoid glycosyltransferase YjiC (YdhE family)
VPEPTPPDVFTLPFVPFSQVYPRCAAVIHHGGIGSVAQALRAGTPMLVVPWGLDQFLLGQRVTNLRVGRWIARGQYTVDRVAPLLGALLADARFSTRARTIAGQIANQDGVAALCDRVERLIRSAEGGSV